MEANGASAERGRIEPHNAKPASVWSSGGGDYDEISSQISSALEHAVRRLRPQPGERILDLATGTGWTSRIAARRGATVVGADIAEDLLASAKRRSASEGLDVEYVIGDAEHLPFDDATFDAVISTFGVMFVTRPEAAAREIARVCRRGGRMALTTWKLDGSVFEMFKVMRTYMTPPPSPPPSPFLWGTRERIEELFGDAFDLAFEDGVTNYYETTAQAAWEAFATGYGPTKSLAASLDPDRRAQLERDFTAFHDGYRSELGICVPRDYLLTIGIRK